MKKILGILALCATMVLADSISDDDHPVILHSENFYTYVLNPDTNQVLTENGWFIKFYAPWCGHCKKLAPVWDQLHVNNKSQLNVGKVDCTSDLAGSLCQQFGVRGYPTLIYFPPMGAPKPSTVDEQGNSVEVDSAFFKYSGMRSLESLEQFALQGGYLTSTDKAEEIPKQLTGMAYWTRKVQNMIQDIQMEIDGLFLHFGLDKYVPKTVRYVVVGSFFISPLLVLIALLCCCFDEEPPAVVKPRAADPVQKKQVLEKID